MCQLSAVGGGTRGRGGLTEESKGSRMQHVRWGTRRAEPCADDPAAGWVQHFRSVLVYVSYLHDRLQWVSLALLWHVSQLIPDNCSQ